MESFSKYDTEKVTEAQFERKYETKTMLSSFYHSVGVACGRAFVSAFVSRGVAKLLLCSGSLLHFSCDFTWRNHNPTHLSFACGVFLAETPFSCVKTLLQISLLRQLRSSKCGRHQSEHSRGREETDDHLHEFCTWCVKRGSFFLARAGASRALGVRRLSPDPSVSAPSCDV